MNALPHPEDIREIVCRTFSELRCQTLSAQEIRETVLIRQGHYYGRSYRCAGYVATLAAETGTLSFYTDEGIQVRAMPLVKDAATEELRKAA